MKATNYYFTIILCVFHLSCTAQTKQKNNATTSSKLNSERSYSEIYFENELNKFKDVKYRKVIGKIICSSSGLDSILKNHSLHILGNILHPVNFANDSSSFLIFYLSTEKNIEGLENYNSYQNGKRYINNMLVLFQLQKDSSYVMTDYIYKPINQGTESFAYFDLIYNKKKQHLILAQYGGNDFGQWWIEFEFEFGNTTKKWMHIKSSLYSASIDINMNYKKEKLIWSKASEKRLPIEEVEFPKQVSYQDLEDLQM